VCRICALELACGWEDDLCYLCRKVRFKESSICTICAMEPLWGG
jgi:hypothetical protein